MFVPPTPENGSTLDFFTNNTIPVNVSVAGTGLHSVFLDWSNSLVGWWNFDFYNSTVVYDNSTYANNATFTGSNFGVQNITSGTRGSKIQFGGNLTGNGWYLNAGNKPSMQVTGNQTIAMWLYPTNLATRRNPWGKAYGGEGTMTQETNGALTYYWGVSGGNNGTGGSHFQTFTSSFLLLPNSWAHVAVVRTISPNATQNGTIQWFYNGALAKTNYASFSQAVASPLNMKIGQAYVNSYTGGIDEVLYFNRSLTQQELLALYDAQANRYSRNFTALPQGDYYFRAWEINTTGIVNSTGLRKVTISSLGQED